MRILKDNWKWIITIAFAAGSISFGVRLNAATNTAQQAEITEHTRKIAGIEGKVDAIYDSVNRIEDHLLNDK